MSEPATPDVHDDPRGSAAPSLAPSLAPSEGARRRQMLREAIRRERSRLEYRRSELWLAREMLELGPARMTALSADLARAAAADRPALEAEWTSAEEALRSAARHYAQLNDRWPEFRDAAEARIAALEAEFVARFGMAPGWDPD